MTPDLLLILASIACSFSFLKNPAAPSSYATELEGSLQMSARFQVPVDAHKCQLLFLKGHACAFLSPLHPSQGQTKLCMSQILFSILNSEWLWVNYCDHLSFWFMFCKMVKILSHWVFWGLNHNKVDTEIEIYKWVQWIYKVIYSEYRNYSMNIFVFTIL